MGAYGLYHMHGCMATRRGPGVNGGLKAPPPTISSAAADRLHAGYVPMTSLRRRAMSATLDRSAAMASRPITISVGWARGRPC